jgi:hypothetical protein
MCFGGPTTGHSALNMMSQGTKMQTFMKEASTFDARTIHTHVGLIYVFAKEDTDAMFSI